MRSRASGVARLQAVAAPFTRHFRFLVRYVHVLRTRDAGRAGAHPLPHARAEQLD